MAHDKPTDEQIAKAIELYLEKHPTEDRVRVDQVRACWEWLDAQNKTAKIVRKDRAVKHMIKQWAACSINWQEVEVASILHPRVRCSKYPYFNISRRLIRPKFERLDGVACAGSHGELGARIDPDDYPAGVEGEPKRARRAKRRWIGSQLVTDR